MITVIKSKTYRNKNKVISYQYIIGVAAGIQVVVVGSDNIRMLVEQAKEHPVLKLVISIDRTVPEDIVAMAKERNIELKTFDEVMVSYCVAIMACGVLKWFIRNLAKRIHLNIRFVWMEM